MLQVGHWEFQEPAPGSQTCAFFPPGIQHHITVLDPTCILHPGGWHPILVSSASVVALLLQQAITSRHQGLSVG